MPGSPSPAPSDRSPPPPAPSPPRTATTATTARPTATAGAASPATAPWCRTRRASRAARRLLVPRPHPHRRHHPGVRRVHPGKHDGTAAFEGPRGATLLVVNHELSGARSGVAHPVPAAEGLVYDPAAPGGCTVVETRRGGEVAQWVGIAGTAQNCAGGTTRGTPG
ncbi:alkaline phosphatase PhoX [Streptomyces zhihengii]